MSSIAGAGSAPGSCSWVGSFTALNLRPLDESEIGGGVGIWVIEGERAKDELGRSGGSHLRSPGLGGWLLVGLVSARYSEMAREWVENSEELPRSVPASFLE